LVRGVLRAGSRRRLFDRDLPHPIGNKGGDSVFHFEPIGELVRHRVAGEKKDIDHRRPERAPFDAQSEARWSEQERLEVGHVNKLLI